MSLKTQKIEIKEFLEHILKQRRYYSINNSGFRTKEVYKDFISWFHQVKLMIRLDYHITIWPHIHETKLIVPDNLNINTHITRSNIFLYNIAKLNTFQIEKFMITNKSVIVHLGEKK